MHRDIQSSEVPDIMGVVCKCANAVAVVLWCGWCCQVRHGHCTACNNCCIVTWHYSSLVSGSTMILSLTFYMNWMISGTWTLTNIFVWNISIVVMLGWCQYSAQSSCRWLTEAWCSWAPQCLPRPGPAADRGSRPGPPWPGTHITLDTGADLSFKILQHLPFKTL